MFWRSWLGEPFLWIFSAFARPRFLEQEFSIRYAQPRQRINALIRLALPMLLVSSLLAYLMVYSIHVEGAVRSAGYPGSGTLFADATFELIGGLGVGLALGLIFGIREGLIGTLLSILAFGLAVDVMGGTIDNAAGVSAVVLILDIAWIFALGFALSSTVRLTVGLLAGIAAVAIESFVLGLIVNSAGGLVIDPRLAAGLIAGIAITYLIGYLRLPFYLASAPSIIRACATSRREPVRVFDCLRHSALYWDEYVHLPLPLLKRTLLIAYTVSPEETLQELAFIWTQRPGQTRVARRVLEEIAMRDLEKRITLEQFAVLEASLAELFPAEARLIDPRLEMPLARLNDASRDAMRAISPIGLPNRRLALEDMQANLLKVQPGTAFRDQRLNARLARVIETWRMVGQEEQKRLTSEAQTVGNLVNPYKPGQFLSLKDSLFVGRRNLAQELEGALSMGSRRPTFLLNGERRMGKTSALQQLPLLLGSFYISVFYNLQQPGLYASTATFLGVLADGITRVMKTRALPVDRLGYDSMRAQQNDASVYSYFNNWLAGVEDMLERENRMLLLAFDEFEMLEEVEHAQSMNVRMLLDWMRSIIQFHPRIALLFSGVKIFTEMGAQSGIDWAGYFINVQMLRISFLKVEEARYLITHPTTHFPGEEIFSREVVEAIIAETGCHPFLIQAVCSALITLLNVQRQEQATLSDVTRAVERVLEDWAGHFAHLWNRTDKEQRACLEALLPLQQASLEQLQAQTQLENKIVRRTMQQLLRRDLVTREVEDSYSIAVPMFRGWLDHNI